MPLGTLAARRFLLTTKTPEAVAATSGESNGSWVLELETRSARPTVLLDIVCCGYLSKEWVYSWGSEPLQTSSRTGGFYSRNLFSVKHKIDENEAQPRVDFS